VTHQRTIRSAGTVKSPGVRRFFFIIFFCIILPFIFSLQDYIAPVLAVEPGPEPMLPPWFTPFLASLAILAVLTIIFLILLTSSVKRKTCALRESEKRFRDVVMNINDWFWETDTRGIFTFSSGKSKALLGYSPGELKGSAMLDILHPEQQGDALDAPNTHEQLATHLKTNSSFRQIPQAFRHKDGRGIHLLLSAIPVYDKKGNFIGFRGVATDISEKILADTEKKALEERLAQSQKMEAVGTLAGGIAHDFNNILTAILGYGELAQEEAPPGSNLSMYLREIIQSGTRAKDLVNQILAFSRRAELSAMPLRPAHIIKEALRMLRPSLPVTIEIRKNVEDTGDCVYANPAQLNQIVINLATNAFHAMEEHGGTLGIILRKVDLAATDLAGEANVRPGPYFLLSVSDSGHGIPPEIRNKIFDPYFTTKRQGKGTGMGLSIVHSAVRDCNGYISCQSEMGQGTTFNVYFPVIKRQAAEAATEDAPIPHGSERILCVDDEKMIVDMLQVLLHNLGYEVRTTTDSGQALEIIRESPDAFDLVITDQTMPKLTGEELSAQLFTIRPDLPIILCTGFSSQITEEKVKKIGVRELVHKPLAKKELALLIRKVLDEQSQSPRRL